MVESYIYNEPSSSMNTMSQPQVSQPTPIDLVEKLKENFAQNATKVDFYKDNTGLNWVAGYVGKAKDGAEWRLWTSYKPAADGSDAKYIATNLNEQQAMDMFKSIVGKDHDEIVKSISPTIPAEEEDSSLKEKEEFVDEPQDVVTSDLKKKDVFETTEPKLKDLIETQTWEKQVEKSKSVPDYLILKAVKGDSQPLINWAGRVGVEKATADLTGKPGIENPSKLANWLIEKAGPRIGKPYAMQAGRKAGKGAGHIVTKEDLPDVSSLDDSALAEIHSNLEGYLATIEKESMKRFKTGTSKKPVEAEGEGEAEAGKKPAPAKMPKIKTPAEKLKEAQGEATEPKTTAGAKGKVSKWENWEDWAWKDQNGDVLSIDPSQWRMSEAEVENEMNMRSQGKGPSGRTLNNGWETAQWNAIRITNQYGYDDPRAKKARQQFHIMAGKNYDRYMNRYGVVERGSMAMTKAEPSKAPVKNELDEQYGIPQKPTESFEEADKRVGVVQKKEAPIKKAVVEKDPKKDKPELASLKKKDVGEVKEPELATLDGDEIKRAPLLANLKVEKAGSHPVSKKQARLFGAVAGGVKTQAKGLSQERAKRDLRGKKLKNLPEKKRSKK